MSNAEKFKSVFGLYATEIWASSEAQFLNWLNADYIDEVQNAEWIKAQGMMPPEMFGVYYCSVCDGKAMRDYKSHKQILTKWCPHCGSKMGDHDEVYN